MIDPSESARRIQSCFQRFGVPVDGDLAAKDANMLGAKRGLGLALPTFIDRVQDELEGADLSDNAVRVLRLRLKQLRTVAEEFTGAPAGDRFEPAELALVAACLDIVVAVLGAALGKEYRAEIQG